jgi:hypothetical protein
MTWIDTLHQPADGGTRPDVDERFRLERPLWLSCRVFLQLFACDSGVTDTCAAAGVETWEAWSVNKGPRFNLLDDKNVRRLLRLVGSGHVAFLLDYRTARQFCQREAASSRSCLFATS